MADVLEPPQGGGVAGSGHGTNRHGDRRLLHWGIGRSLLRKCPSRRRDQAALDPVVPQLAQEDERQVPEDWVELVDEHTGKANFWNPLSYATSWSRPRRKREKRRKKKLPRTSSHSSCGRALRRQRQWHASGWFSAGHAVFPSYFGRPKMPGFSVGIDSRTGLLRC